jgi:hypothetical protein
MSVAIILGLMWVSPALVLAPFLLRAMLKKAPVSGANYDKSLVPSQ